MDFQKAAKIGSLLSKYYTEDVFNILVNYQAVSASEVATHIGLHIKTAQDYLEGLTELDILSKDEVFEKKRPYFRYVLKKDRIVIDIDLMQVKRTNTKSNLDWRVKEKSNAGARFSLARNSDHISNVTIWIGEGRERQEKKIKLTSPQGQFLYYLPFPKAESKSIKEIIRIAGVDDIFAPEILDLVQMLIKYGVIEKISNSTNSRSRD